MGFGKETPSDIVVKMKIWGNKERVRDEEKILIWLIGRSRP